MRDAAPMRNILALVRSVLIYRVPTARAQTGV
jgi:hypothetical protein